MKLSVISKVADSMKGKLDIYPRIEGNTSEVVIIGDPRGLRDFARLLETIADFDQDSTTAPIGSREHTHLTPRTHLGGHSTYVEVCRADAKGTGELPEYMED